MVGEALDFSELVHKIKNCEEEGDVQIIHSEITRRAREAVLSCQQSIDEQYPLGQSR